VAIEFAPAVRSAEKARIALAGPAGSGKTYTALALATFLAAPGGVVGVIDTERGSAAKYEGINGWQFHTYRPPAYSPQSLIETLSTAAGYGFAVLVVDSWSHYWMGAEGMLEQVDKRTPGGGSSFQSGWKDMRPHERRMIDALISYPGHVIATLRTKSEWVIERDEKGKNKPVRVGLKPEQREGMEYEFDVVGELDLSNTLTISKTRVPSLHGAVIDKPGADLARTIRDWLADGADRPGPLEYRALVLDATSLAELRQLHADVQRAGLLNAPVVSADDLPMLLGELIEARMAEPQPADAARTALRALVKQHRWDAKRVGAAYRATHDGADLNTEADADRIRAFTADLAAAPEQVLSLAGGATA
jgi:hypothetical protein